MKKRDLPAMADKSHHFRPSQIQQIGCWPGRATDRANYSLIPESLYVHTRANTRKTCAARQNLSAVLALGAAPPDLLRLRSPDELVTKIRMCDRDQRLGTLPRAASGEIYHAVLRREVIRCERGDVTMSPPKCGRMREWRTPSLSVKVDVMQMNALPPRAMAAPVRKSS